MASVKPLSPEDLAVLLDLSRKAESDVLAALDRVIRIAPVEAKPGIMFHVAFTLCSYSASMVEAVRARAKGVDPAPIVKDGILNADYARSLRSVLGAFNLFPDTARVDRALTDLLVKAGGNVRSNS